jgi:hypothetical protein
MKLLNCFKKRGREDKSSRGDEFDQKILYTFMEISQ